MRKVFFTIIFICFAHLGFGFHIIGGEIELIHMRDFTYNLNLIQYFDRAQSDNPNPDVSASLYIYRNSDNSLVELFTLPFISETTLDPSNQDCRRRDLDVTRIIYSLEVTLSEEDYNDPEGYHISWERCCRNEGIVNIENPSGTGNTYVLEFPAVSLDGNRFINSSPIMNLPVNDFACVDQLFSASFQAFDEDGDSLVYAISVPLNSSSTVPVPTPPASRDQQFVVTLADGVTLDNIVSGNPSLNITDHGILSVIPSNPGLYVYAITVEEFRNGVQIGKIVRDYQLLVDDFCTISFPPTAGVKFQDDPVIYENQVMINFDVGDEKCFDVLVGDLISQESADIHFDPINFQVEDLGFVISQDRFSSDSSLFNVCVPECPFILDEPYIIDIIVSDDACPQPKRDTIRASIWVESPPNNQPEFSNLENDELTISLKEGENFSKQFIGIDSDLDELQMILINKEGESVDFSDLGIVLEIKEAVNGEIIADLIWNTSCEINSFNGERKLGFSVLLNDVDFCDMPGDTVDVTFEMDFNDRPFFADFENDEVIEIVLNEGQTYEREFIGEDLNLDLLSLSLVESSVEDLAARGVNLEVTMNEGGSIVGLFSWEPNCEVFDFTDDRSFQVGLQLQDDDPCGIAGEKIVLNLMADFSCENTVTEISEDTLENNVSVQLKEDGLLIHSPNTEERVTIYDLSGKLVFHDMVNFYEQTAVLSINLNSNQLYIVRIDEKSFKVLMR